MANPGAIAILFDRVVWKGGSQTVHVRLIAAAQWMDVEGSRNPVGGTDRATSDPSQWTTQQIGGDEVYRQNWYGKVYNEYSEPVGSADADGVYANPHSSGGVPLAVGPFSSTARGLYDLPDLSLASAGGNGQPIVFRVVKAKGELHRGDALLLEVIH